MASRAGGTGFSVRSVSKKTGQDTKVNGHFPAAVLESGGYVERLTSPFFGRDNQRVFGIFLLLRVSHVVQKALREAASILVLRAGRVHLFCRGARYRIRSEEMQSPSMAHCVIKVIEVRVR